MIYIKKYTYLYRADFARTNLNRKIGFPHAGYGFLPSCLCDRDCLVLAKNKKKGVFCLDCLFVIFFVKLKRNIF